MNVSLGQPQDAQAIPVRVQIIDVEAASLDIVVPTYIPARDLTQRIARDAGLGAYWEDGNRRNFWLRARGRVIGDDEKLQDLGIVPNELLHLLPQPKDPAAIVERTPDYPPNEERKAATVGRIIGSFALLSAWTVALGMVFVERPTVLATALPSIGLAMLATSFARHLWGGQARSAKVPLTGVVLFGLLLVLAAAPSLAFGVEAASLGMAAGVALVLGLGGVVVAWLAWMGAVAPLPKAVTEAAVQQAEQAAAPVACAICGNAVTPDLQSDCMFRCGRTFHTGCYRARQAMAGNDVCGVCGFRPAT